MLHLITFKTGTQKMMMTKMLTTAARVSLGAYIILSLTGCGSGKKEQAMAETQAAVIQASPVQVAVAELTTVSVTKTFSGTLEGEDQANVVAKISERITSIAAANGASIAAGQTTITLDKSGTSSQYFQSQANYKNAEKTYERMKSLFAEGAISQEQLDGAQTAYTVAKANFDAARGAVDLTAPISGVVTAVNVSKGDLAVPGAVLMTIAKIGHMKVIFSANESDVTALAVGQPVTVYSDNRPEVKAEGRIVQLSKSADVGSRSFEVKALFPNTRDNWFKPGMFCKVNSRLTTGQRSVVIPNTAIQTDGVSSRVFVVANGRSYKRAVVVGVSDGVHSQILQGVAERDTLATVGINNLKDSAAVNVVGVQK
jgi:membrane fusion protein, multidrug efflux system